MTKKLTLTLALTLILYSAFGQIIDRYGINIGASYSNQIWDYKLIPFSPEHHYKVGLMTFIIAEKDFGKVLSLRTGVGYLQKGFKNRVEMTSVDGTSLGESNENMVLHNLALDLGLKLCLKKTNYSPYLLIGIRADYMISYKDVELEEQASGQKYGMFKEQLEKYNKFNVGGLLGLGIDIKQLCYFEIEFNPNLTKNFNSEGLSIKDICWGAKFGVNINK